MSTQRYSTANAAFYCACVQILTLFDTHVQSDGYIVAVLPVALLLQRLPLVKTLSAFIFIWGVVCLLTITVTNYPGLVTQRIFLGLVEVRLYPLLS